MRIPFFKKLGRKASAKPTTWKNLPSRTAVPESYDWHQEFEFVPGEKSYFTFAEPEYYDIAVEHTDFIREDGKVVVGLVFAHKHSETGESCEVEIDIAIRHEVLAEGKRNAKYKTPWIISDIEHMSLSPSIVCKQDGCKAHGFLNKGKWSDVNSMGKRKLEKEIKKSERLVFSPVPATRRD